MADARFNLATLPGVVSLFQDAPRVRLAGAIGKRSCEDGELHCSKCGGLRRADVTVRYRPNWQADFGLLDSGVQAELRLVPALLEYRCGDCHSVFTAVIYEGPDGPAYALFPSTAGGIATQYTPDGVGYYLHQAFLSQSVGAYSAAMAMYRAALEHVLFGAGFETGTCGRKLHELQKALDSGDQRCPGWAREINPQFMTVLKNLADGALHPNDGNIERQKNLDRDLLGAIEATFQDLLEKIYDAPRQAEARLHKLQEAERKVGGERDKEVATNAPK